MHLKSILAILTFLLSLIFSSAKAQGVSDHKLLLIQNITSLADADLIYRAFIGDSMPTESPTPKAGRSERSLVSRGPSWLSTARRKQHQKSPMQSLLPMFIVPFLVQSAIIPIMLSVLKFMLLASFTVGKLALIFSAANAFKNANKSEPEHMMYHHSGNW